MTMFKAQNSFYCLDIYDLPQYITYYIKVRI